MKMLIINNTASGYQDGSIYDFLRCVTRPEDETVIRSFENFDHLDELLKDVDIFDLVVCAGDDSTVSAIAYAIKNTKKPMMVFPAGTANMIAQNLLLPGETHALSKLTHNLNTLDFDLGEIVDINDTNKAAGFGVMASVGFSNDVTEGARTKKQHFGHLAYIYSALTVKNPKVYTFDIEFDNEVKHVEAIGLMVMNFSKIGLDLSITHSNRPRDGKLDIILLKAKKPLGYLPAFTAATIDKAINFPDRSDAIEIYTTKSAKISCSETLSVYVDEMKTDINTPFTVNALPGSVKYIIDEEGSKFYADPNNNEK